MSTGHVPASVGLSRAINAEVAALAASVVAVRDELRAGLEVIAAGLQIEMPPAQDTEAIAWARRRANAATGQESVERILEQMSAAKAAANRASKFPPLPRRDGSTVQQGDPDFAEVDRQAFIGENNGRFSQAARHAAMAADPEARRKAQAAHLARERARQDLYARQEAEHDR